MEKKKKRTSRLHWALFLLAWMGGFIVAAYAVPYVPRIRLIGSVTLGALVYGLIIGSVQQVLITHTLGVSIRYWIPTTIVTAGIATGINGMLLRSGIDGIWFFIPVVYSSILGLTQYCLLRMYVRDAWLWVLANAVGALVLQALYTNFNSSPLDIRFITIFNPIAIITGLTMYALIAKHHINQQQKSSEEG